MTEAFEPILLDPAAVRRELDKIQVAEPDVAAIDESLDAARRHARTAAVHAKVALSLIQRRA